MNVGMRKARRPSPLGLAAAAMLEDRARTVPLANPCGDLLDELHEIRPRDGWQPLYGTEVDNRRREEIPGQERTDGGDCDPDARRTEQRLVIPAQRVLRIVVHGAEQAMFVD